MILVTVLLLAQSTADAPAQVAVPQPLPAPPTSPPPPNTFLSRIPRPYGNPGAWVKLSDYPRGARSEGREGVVGFRVIVARDGSVQDCAITSSSGWSDLDARVCELLRLRGRFHPALDEAGQPTVGSWSSRVRWQLPG